MHKKYRSMLKLVTMSLLLTSTISYAQSTKQDLWLKTYLACIHDTTHDLKGEDQLITFCGRVADKTVARFTEKLRSYH